MVKNSPHIILNYFYERLEFNKLSLSRDAAIEEIKEKYAGLIDSVDVEKGIIGNKQKPFIQQRGFSKGKSDAMNYTCYWK